MTLYQSLVEVYPDSGTLSSALGSRTAVQGAEIDVQSRPDSDEQSGWVEALILVTLISLVVSRVLLDFLREIVDREAAHEDGDESSSRILRRRWSRVFSRYGELILRRIAAWLATTPRRKTCWSCCWRQPSTYRKEPFIRMIRLGVPL